MRIYVYLGAMKKRLIQTPMRPFIWILSFILVSGLVFGISLKNEDPNKDKLLLEIISYVLDRGHYDPKEINDTFSENVYMNYLENLDGQHRFFLNADILSFEPYRYKIDDELKESELRFFDLTYSKITERMAQVALFYNDILSTPFVFSKKEEITLDFDQAPYASSMTELKKIWRKRFKLNALESFISKKEDESKRAEKDSTFIKSSDKEIELSVREDLKENMDNLFENYNDFK